MVLGTVAMTKVPLNVVATSAMTTVMPALNPCGADVVIVATFDVSARLVTVALLIAPLFEVASKVTVTPLGVPFTLVLAEDVPVAFVAVAPN